MRDADAPDGRDGRDGRRCIGTTGGATADAQRVAVTLISSAFRSRTAQKHLEQRRAAEAARGAPTWQPYWSVEDEDAGGQQFVSATTLAIFKYVDEQWSILHELASLPAHGRRELSRQRHGRDSGISQVCMATHQRWPRRVSHRADTPSARVPNASSAAGSLVVPRFVC